MPFNVHSSPVIISGVNSSGYEPQWRIAQREARRERLENARDGIIETLNEAADALQTDPAKGKQILQENFTAKNPNAEESFAKKIPIEDAGKKA